MARGAVVSSSKVFDVFESRKNSRFVLAAERPMTADATAKLVVTTGTATAADGARAATDFFAAAAGRSPDGHNRHAASNASRHIGIQKLRFITLLQFNFSTEAES